MIKFLDIYNQDKILHSKIINKIKKLFKTGDFILGNEVNIFEEKFAKFTNLNMQSVVVMVRMLLQLL